MEEVKYNVFFVERLGNALELSALCLMLILAFTFQFILHELPCPLCLLQRLGFLGVAFGVLLNLRFGPRPSHYGFILLSALLTAFVALRQIALHVVPGTGHYGHAVFGLHLYTWSFVIAMLIVIFNVLMLSVDKQYGVEKKKSSKLRQRCVDVLLVVTLILALGNAVSVSMECGIGQCPDNPVSYLH